MAVLGANGTLAALSFHYGLTKSDLLDLTPVELESYLDGLEEIGRQARRR